MQPEQDTGNIAYVIPARTLSGSVPQLLDEIDDMVEALHLVRATVVALSPKPALPSRLSWLGRCREWLGLRVRQPRPEGRRLTTTAR